MACQPSLWQREGQETTTEWLTSPDWSPIRLFSDAGGALSVNWAAVGCGPFTRPFFDQEVEAAFAAPDRSLFQSCTPVEALGEVDERSESVPIGGLIFHASRCGSTLLAGMLAALPEHTVLSEPCAVDHLLSAEFEQFCEPGRWLGPLLRVLARRRRAEEQKVFFKLDSWHILDFQQILRALPDVPWIFLYRDPVEILASHERRRGLQMIPGGLPPERLRVPCPPEPTAAGLATHAARVLGRFLEAALEAQARRPETGRLVHYDELTADSWPLVMHHFGVAVTPAHLPDLLKVRHRDAKHPARAFTPDGHAKRCSASDDVRRAAEAHARPAYERLEAARASQSTSPT